MGGNRRWLYAGTAMLAAGVLVVLAVHVSPRPYPKLPERSGAPRTPHLNRPTPPAVTATPKPPVAGKQPHVAWIIEVLVGVLVASLLLAAIIALCYLVPRIRRWRRGVRARRPGEEPGRAPDDVPRALDVAVSSGLADLTRGPVDEAIIACWLGLEAAAQRVGIPAHPADTPEEFVVRVLTSAGGVDAQPLQRLAALYREARFSRHQMSEDDRAAARAALEDVRAGLVVVNDA